MKRLFQSLSGTSDGAFIIDNDHRVIFWNRAAEEILEYTSEEAVGRPCYEILGGRDEQGRTLWQRYCLVAIRSETGDVLPNLEVYARTKTGKWRWLNVTTFAYPAADKTIGQVIVHLFRDATKNKNYQRFVARVLAASDQLQGDKKPEFSPVDLADSRTGRLTARERQVLELMAQGWDTKDMADTLAIKPSTVRNHVQHILGKLGVHSHQEAIAYARQLGLIEIDES